MKKYLSILCAKLSCSVLVNDTTHINVLGVLGLWAWQNAVFLNVRVDGTFIYQWGLN